MIHPHNKEKWNHRILSKVKTQQSPLVTGASITGSKLGGWGHREEAGYILSVVTGRGATYHITDRLDCVIKAHAVLIHHAQSLLEGLLKRTPNAHDFTWRNMMWGLRAGGTGDAHNVGSSGRIVKSLGGSQAHSGGIYVVSLRILHLQLFLPTIFMWILEQSQRPNHWWLSIYLVSFIHIVRM